MSKTMTPETLYEMLKKFQEPKGFYFNADMGMTMPLLESLLQTKERYGYMACPCRLALGEYEADRDIICPCVYREPDMEEYGACFCGLYVTKEWNEGTIEHKVVPERRPPEKLLG
ncbi:ferredoxin thioredoxin reductase beta chain [Oleidesulfovibrio alaskensis G20]|jgi:ferredoxin-thioredoxin reductase catalytic subunit|uniref:ferredoxin:thioredoxin reductase n=1 Tax=Oleidesulfovibrio alaskensis (strain ATCC BAA-1058 / DSM 17464 / G20) TaxID=207559 RepID=Q30XR2_OLEA2|nr:ferredoxin thioredoxin reductase beta chain [Oleidesulfovibrio alaskensis G20]